MKEKINEIIEKSLKENKGKYTNQIVENIKEIISEGDVKSIKTTEDNIETNILVVSYLENEKPTLYVKKIKGENSWNPK